MARLARSNLAHARATTLGAAMLEFAITAPLFLLILGGLIDQGLAFRDLTTITAAARYGARVAASMSADDDASGPSFSCSLVLRCDRTSLPQLVCPDDRDQNQTLTCLARYSAEDYIRQHGLDPADVTARGDTCTASLFGTLAPMTRLELTYTPSSRPCLLCHLGFGAFGGFRAYSAFRLEGEC